MSRMVHIYVSTTKCRERQHELKKKSRKQGLLGLAIYLCYSTSSAMEENTTTSSAMEENTTTSSAMEENTTTSSAMEENTTTSSAMEENTTTSSAVEENTKTSSAMEENTTKFSRKKNKTTQQAKCKANPTGHYDRSFCNDGQQEDKGKRKRSSNVIETIVID